MVIIIEILLPQPAKRLRKKKEEQGSERSFCHRQKRSSADFARRMAITYNDLFLDIRRELKQGGVIDTTLEARELTCFGVNRPGRS